MKRALSVLLTMALAAATAPKAAAADASTSPTHDRAAIHGMLLFGHDALYVSHLPMFHSPHDYQAIAEIEFDAAGSALQRDDADRHPRAIYTVEPTADAVLSELFRDGSQFAVNVYRGHFERGGEKIATAVPVTVRRIIHFRRFEPSRHAPRDRWLAFGHGQERFLAHRIEAPDDFDQVLALANLGAATDDADVTLAAAGALQEAATTPAGRVTRVIYTEYDDLRAPVRH